MKVKYISDLHLGRSYSNQKVREYMLQCESEDADVLVIAGDLASIHEIENIESSTNEVLKDFIKYCSAHFRETIIVPGNHEFYDGTELSLYTTGCTRNITSNVHIISNNILCVDDVYFVCSTLWSNVSLENIPYVNSYMNDCRLINYFGNRFMANRFQYAHTECKNFLTKALTHLDRMKIPSCKVVVVSHHCPLFACENPIHAGGHLSSAFIADDMEDLITAFSPAYWIYGHTHYNKDVVFCDTNVVSNQMGYSAKESEKFDFGKFFCI